MSLQVKLELTTETKRWMRKYSGQFERAFYKALRRAMFYAERKAKSGFGSGGRPKVVTGNLRRSIQSDVETKYNSQIGILFSNVIYAAIQEEGGKIKPKVKDWLRFQVDGQWRFAKQVILKPKPFLEPALTENITSIQKIIRDELVKQMNRPE